MKKLFERKAVAGQVFRIGVKGGGCSGFEYVFKLDDRRLPIDIVFVADGFEVVCDQKSAEFLRGTVLEYSGNLMSGGFAFKNPNAKRSCGCGTSFSV